MRIDPNTKLDRSSEQPHFTMDVNNLNVVKKKVKGKAKKKGNEALCDSSPNKSLVGDGNKLSS